ncbi:hypothetical protein [Haladaptatus sp. R4]|uniref:hypothetical protein n=1 Tax=Haladaptatus sp. R4 TaxID=1679489 RepID=UPI000AF0F382|nr:hypothetical protein [Haladaptatus sp. R4]
MIRDIDDQFDRWSFLKYGIIARIGTIFVGCTGNQSPETTSDNSTDSTEKSGGANTSSTEFRYGTTISPSWFDPLKGSDNIETDLFPNRLSAGHFPGVYATIVSGHDERRDEDFLNDYITMETARNVYGVVLTNDRTIGDEATIDGDTIQ